MEPGFASCTTRMGFSQRCSFANSLNTSASRPSSRVKTLEACASSRYVCTTATKACSSESKQRATVKQRGGEVGCGAELLREQRTKHARRGRCWADGDCDGVLVAWRGVAGSGGLAPLVAGFTRSNTCLHSTDFSD